MQSQIDQKSNDEFEPYFVKSDLKNIHEETKEAALSQVRYFHFFIFSYVCNTFIYTVSGGT